MVSIQLGIRGRTTRNPDKLLRTMVVYCGSVISVTTFTQLGTELIHAYSIAKDLGETDCFHISTH